LKSGAFRTKRASLFANALDFRIKRASFRIKRASFLKKVSKVSKKLQKYAEVRRFCAKVNQNARFLRTFFVPPCAFDVMWTVRILYLVSREAYLDARFTREGYSTGKKPESISQRNIATKRHKKPAIM